MHLAGIQSLPAVHLGTLQCGRLSLRCYLDSCFNFVRRELLHRR